MVIKISNKLGLAAVGGRYYGSTLPFFLGSVEVTEFLEYTDKIMVDSARDLLESDYAETVTVEG